jgi:predicted flap endonuclease-1-like 5' DNA nuclease
MLGSFIIGYLLSNLLNNKSLKNDLERTLDENRKLKLLGVCKPKDEHANTTFTNNKIKAKKTMERSGMAVSEKKLDFSNFGTASEKEKNDLKKISGVGPFIEKKLNSIGIYTFEQVSKFSDKDIDNVTNLIEFFPGRILRDDWREQANTLMNKDKTESNIKEKKSDDKKNKD